MCKFKVFFYFFYFFFLLYNKNIMASIFSLKTSQSQLDQGNAGIANAGYDQIAPTRDVTNANFSNGSIHIKWSVSGTKHWNPSRSYLRTRVKLSKADGSQLTSSDGIAPNMMLMSNLFQSLEFRINDKTVSRIADFVPQIDALQMRTTKSKAWIDSVGDSSQLTGASFSARQNVCAVGANQAVKIVTKAEMNIAATDTLAYTSADGTVALVGITAAEVQNAFPVGSVLSLNGKKLAVVAHVTAGILCAIGGVDEAANADFQREDTVDSPQARSASEFELCWKPPLSLFNVDHAMPAGEYELIMNPQSSSIFKTSAIESSGVTSKTGGTGNDFELAIQNMYMYVHTVDGPRVENQTYLLDLKNTSCMADSIDNVSFAQKNFEVPPSTYALTVAYQDARVNSHTAVSASKFKSANAGLTLLSEEQKLNRFYLAYAGKNMPSPDADPSFDVTTDRTTQRYLDSIIGSGTYFSEGGAETLAEWHERGSYYYFPTPKDGSDTSTRVSVHSGFAAGTDVANLRVLLFAHSRSTAQITVESGRVVSVEVVEV